MQDNSEEIIDVTNVDWEMEFIGKSNYIPSSSYQPLASINIKNDCCWRCASYLKRKYLESSGSLPYCVSLPKYPLIAKRKERFAENYQKRPRDTSDIDSFFDTFPKTRNVNPNNDLPFQPAQNKAAKLSGSNASKSSGTESQLPSITINKGIITNYYSDIRFPKRILETDSLSETEDDD